MARTKVKPTPESLMKYRAVENIRPLGWWLGTYKDDDGNSVEMWTQVSIVMESEQIATGRKIVRVYGTCTDGEPAELAVYRGAQVQSLTGRDGTRCGLTTEQASDDGLMAASTLVASAKAYLSALNKLFAKRGRLHAQQSA